MRIASSLLCFFVFLLSTQAEARHYRHHAHHSHHRHYARVVKQQPSNDFFFNWFASGQQQVKEARARKLYAYAPSHRVNEETYSAPAISHATHIQHHESQIVGGRPAGCPYQYCGCYVSLKVFGKIIPSLNLAANWFRFPRAIPAPGMVAVKSHHVFYIAAVNSDGTVIAHDGNSGRHLTRIHARSLSGYRVVNPHG